MKVPTGSVELYGVEDLVIEEDKQKGALTDSEGMDSGAIKWSTCVVYMKAAGGVCITMATLASFIIPVGLSVFTNYWLAFWLQECSQVCTIYTRGQCHWW